jgi:hypothetical protein
MIERQMLLGIEPKLSPEWQAQIRNAHGKLADEINRKGTRPVNMAALALTISATPTQAQVQAVADRCDALLTALMQ